MNGRWYESRTVQASIIGGVALVAAAAITALPSIISRRSVSTTFEIKTIGNAGEETLARLALDPTGQVVDSAAFARLSQSLLINDSLGIAFARPEGQEWTVGPLGKLQDIDLFDLPFFAAFSDMERRGWPRDTVKTQVRFFGTRRDYPVRVRLTTATAIDSVVLGTNRFRDATTTIAWIRAFSGDDYASLPRDSVVAYGVQLFRWMDSLITAKLPADKQLYSGVFIARVTRENFPAGMWTWIMSDDLMENVAAYVRSGLRAPSMLIVDRDHGYLIVNETVRLTNAEVNGQEHKDLILNRIGYAVKAGDAAYMVELQYVSADATSILPELQRVFRSVHLRSGPTAAR